MNEAKKLRTVAKSALTRAANTIQRLKEQGHPEPEIFKASAILQATYDKVVARHEVFTILVEETY